MVRVSGKNLRRVVTTLAGSTPEPRRATLSKFFDGKGSVIDEGIVLYFPAPHSYTGEDVLELQGHGGTAVMSLLLASCLSAGARLAQPGEFTLRAFLNNKLDLVQAESVADIIDASTSEAARCAVRSLRGEFSHAIHGMVQALTDLRILVEASLDFPEEEIDVVQQVEVVNKLAALLRQLENVFSSARQGSVLREGISIVLVGRPNVGKSSLLNRLTGEEAAIVTAIAGTTRDAIRQTIEIEGVPLHLVDTAGLRETDDTVEKIGIERTRSVIGKANLALLILDSRLGVTPEDSEILGTLPTGLPVVHVYNKTDLADRIPPLEDDAKSKSEIYVSAKTGAGIDLLREKLLELAGWQPDTQSEGVFMARHRHLHALEEARNHVTYAVELGAAERHFDLVAEELRLAQKQLSSITGEFSPDDLLGEIFSRFCIGK